MHQRRMGWSILLVVEAPGMSGAKNSICFYSYLFRCMVDGNGCARDNGSEVCLNLCQRFSV